MKKKVLCLAMALVMLAGGSLTAHAEELKGQDGWRAEFNGKKIVSNFDSGTLADEAGNVQPGDSITLKVEIKNSDTGSTDWYMTNEAIQSLEDAADVAQGGAYSYRLAYKGPKGQEIEIYNSENVGGESTTGKLGGTPSGHEYPERLFLPGQTGVRQIRHSDSEGNGRGRNPE